jgi:hypothetical protein
MSTVLIDMLFHTILDSSKSNKTAHYDRRIDVCMIV